MGNTYTLGGQKKRRQKSSKLKPLLGVLLLVIIGFAAYKLFGPTSVEKTISRLQFDQSVTEQEKQKIESAITEQEKAVSGNIPVRIETTLEATESQHILSAYVPVTHAYSVRQSVATSDFATLGFSVPAGTDELVKQSLARAVAVDASQVRELESPDLKLLPEEAIVFLPVDQLSQDVKLLQFGGNYYLDSFSSGALFRQAVFGDADSDIFSDLNLSSLATSDQILTVNTTGVTALTRMMMRKLSSVGDPTFFSAEIGEFMASADITHISNEVSFTENCQWHAALFCSPMEFIETLKASGVDVVELTGNHNNDLGSVYNTNTIELYHSLGWKTFGGGLNDEEAAKPALFDQKGTKVAFLGYNYPDSPNGGAISGPTSAGANRWDIAKIESDIAAAKQQNDFVFVHIQFWECYAYPEGYLEFPQCDAPIPNQEPVFKQVADLGADMIIGSSAHQPQTYEIYNGVPIYYGLGNMYFDQDRWPGTERGIILTHYFNKGKLIQTKLTPTVYDSDYQTRRMTAEEAEYLLGRLNRAR